MGKGSMNAQMARDTNDGSVFNTGFIILTALFFLTSSAMAAFFQLHSYLQSIEVSPVWIGFIIGADSLASFVVQPLCAPYLHPGNGRLWMVIGALIMAAALLAYTSARSIGALVTIRVIQGAGFVLFLAAMMGVIVAYIPPSRSGQGFGFLALIRLFPYAVVPPMMTFLMERAVAFPVILAGFALLISVSLLLLFVVRPTTLNTGGNKSDANNGPAGIRQAAEGLKDRKIIMLLVVNLLVFICYTIVFFYISEYGRYTGIVRPDLFFTVATIVMVAVRLCGSAFFDKYDKDRVTIWCLSILAAAFFFLPYGRGWFFYLLAAIFGLGWGAVMPLVNAMVFDESLPQLRGVNLNLALVAMQGGFFLGPLMGGFILTSAGYTALFLLCCPLTILALVAMLFGKK